MRFGAIALCLTVSITASAKIADNTTNNNAACPVEIQSFGSVFSTQRSALGNYEARYRNKSTKTIIGVKFGIELMDAVGDFRPTVAGIDYAGKLEPTKKAHVTGNIIEYVNTHKDYPGERLTVVKVAFNDGTTWSDDGKGTCHMTYDRRKI
jgi:hypothetical protein